MFADSSQLNNQQQFAIAGPSKESGESGNVVGAGEHVAGAHETFIQVEQLQKGMCGISRPHFFRGVATVSARSSCLHLLYCTGFACHQQSLEGRCVVCWAGFLLSHGNSQRKTPSREQTTLKNASSPQNLWLCPKQPSTSSWRMQLVRPASKHQFVLDALHNEASCQVPFCHHV